MRLFLLFTFLFLLINASPAQVTELDSPDRLILKAKSDTAHINLENKRNKIISRMNVDSAMVNNKRIIREANAIHYTDGVASARLNLATNYCIKGEFALGRQNLDKALQMFRSVPDSAGICDNWSGNGMFYGMQSKYDSFIACLEKAIAIAEKNDLINNLSVYFGKNSHWPPDAGRFQECHLLPAKITGPGKGYQ